MTNNLYILACLVIASISALPTHAQEFDDQGEVGIYGYTSIDFDPSTNVVTAYSETDVYGEALYFYLASVVLTSNGVTSQQTAQVPSDSSVSTTLDYQGSTGNTYTATGQHEVVMTSKWLGGADSEYYKDDDAFGFIAWQFYDISNPWEFPFTTLESAEAPELGPTTLGETYDTAQTSIPASCGTGDQRNTIIQEYVTYNTVYYPQCAEFAQSVTGSAFTFQQLNSGNYSWAILRSYFIPKLNSLESSAPFTVRSAYRNPAAESVAATNNNGRFVPGSRHMYGDAVDIVTTQSTWSTYQTYGHQLGACVEPTSVQGGSYTHAHLDWRDLATVGPTYTGCPKNW